MIDYKDKEPCPSCGKGNCVKLINFEDSKTIRLCLECDYIDTVDTPYQEYIKNNGKPYFKARTIKMYGLEGIDKENFLNVRTNKDKIFVFGDNLIGQGKGGQAIIRDEKNAFGIPTKRLPSMSEEAFFSDKEDERKAVLSKLRELYKLSKSGIEIVFPKDGLGTGLAEMHIRSPKLFKEMNDIIFEYWNIKFEEPKIELTQNSLFE